MTDTETPAVTPGHQPRRRHAGAHAWLALQSKLTTLPQPTPCQSSSTAPRWISDAPDDQEAAAHACTPCPVRTACAAYAVTAAEVAGVWGGTTPADRRSSTSPAS